MVTATDSTPTEERVSSTRLYTDPTADAAIKSRAMDSFDRLMKRYSFEAQRALEEWDRR